MLTTHEIKGEELIELLQEIIKGSQAFQEDFTIKVMVLDEHEVKLKEIPASNLSFFTEYKIHIEAVDERCKKPRRSNRRMGRSSI